MTTTTPKLEEKLKKEFDNDFASVIDPMCLEVGHELLGYKIWKFIQKALQEQRVCTVDQFMMSLDRLLLDDETKLKLAKLADELVGEDRERLWNFLSQNTDE